MKRLGDPAIVLILGNAEWAPTEADMEHLRKVLAEHINFGGILVTSRDMVKLKPTEQLLEAFAVKERGK